MTSRAAAPNTDDGTSGEEERSWALGLAVFALAVGGVALAELDRVSRLDVALVVVPALAFLARAKTDALARWGVYLATFVPIVGLNATGLRSEGVLFLSILAVSYISFFEDRRWIAYVCGAAAVASPVVALVVADDDSWGWQFWMLGAAFGMGFSEIGHRYRKRLDELRATQAIVADQALLDERRRIARDVHDLVGHSLAVVMLQVTAARELVRRDPAEAEAALDDAARVGRESLTEIRHTLGLLRDGEGDGTVPSPRLTDIGALVDEFRSAGLDVECEISGDPDGLERTRSIAGYRIVQEALANASKHGAGGMTTLDIAVGDDALAISVSSPIANGTAPGSGGYGLVGMRERASSVGGTLLAGPHASRWVVEATLPRMRT